MCIDRTEDHDLAETVGWSNAVFVARPLDRTALHDTVQYQGRPETFAYRRWKVEEVLRAPAFLKKGATVRIFESGQKLGVERRRLWEETGMDEGRFLPRHRRAHPDVVPAPDAALVVFAVGTDPDHLDFAMDGSFETLDQIPAIRKVLAQRPAP